MRNRRGAKRGLFARAADAGGSWARGLLGRAAQRPVDTVALFAAVATSLIIVVNAVFMQSGSHPAPFFANPKPPQLAAGEALKPAAPVAPPRPAAAPVAPQPVAARRNDPIADLIGPSPRIAAVQRALSDYGYGQVKPSGVLDEPTSAAIEKFERDHKLPVTGRVSDRLVADLTAMVGHPLE